MLFPGRTRRGSIFFPHLQFPSDQLRIVFKGQRFTNCSGHCHVGSDTATDLDPGATASPLYSGTQSRFPDPASSDHIVPLRQSRRSLGDHKTRFQCANGSTWLLCVQRMQKHMHMHHTIVRGKNCCVFLLCRIRNESLSTEDASCESRRRCRESRVGHVHHGHAGGHVCPVPRCSRMRCATLSLTPSPRLMRWPWTLATACHTSAPWSTLNMLICSRESASLCHLRLSSWNAKKECALYGSTSIRYRRHPGSSVLSVCQESNPPGGYQNSPRKLSDADADRNPGCCLLRFSTAFWRRELHGPPEIHPPDLDGPRWSSLNRPDTRPAAPNTSPAPPVTSYAADETGELVPTSCVL
mmetsp:Transcript_10359/g.21309  ORF Transcript_10359/g.21309 Transcript_10359/m.21309 type:complete len:354 (-) Transcript_10359:590-1651(-)